MSEKEYEQYEIKNMSREKANAVLNPRDFNKWKKIHDLEKNAEKNRINNKTDKLKAKEEIIQAAENNITENITIETDNNKELEFEVLITMNRTQRDLLMKVSKIQEKFELDDKEKIKQLNEEDLKIIEKLLINFLNEIVKNYEKKVLKEIANQTGILGLNWLIAKIIKKHEKINKKKEKELKN